MAKPTYDDLVKALLINRDGLDEELVRQPHVFQMVAENSARANSERDRAKDELKRTEAKRYEAQRARLEETGGKVTEAMVNSAVIQDEVVAEATEALRDATREAEEWSALRESFSQRSYALKDLVQLFVASYFETDRSTAGSRSVVDRKDYEDGRRKIAKARRERMEA